MPYVPPILQPPTNRLMAAAGAVAVPSSTGQAPNRLASVMKKLPNLYERPETLADLKRLTDLYKF